MGVLCLDEETHGNKVPRVSGRRPHSRECLPRPPVAPGVVEALGGTGVVCICFLGSGGASPLLCPSGSPRPRPSFLFLRRHTLIFGLVLDDIDNFC